ncbi:hypothetical protein AB0I72_19730 [Nocardiopsis sp. NPDC049922]
MRPRSDGPALVILIVWGLASFTLTLLAIEGCAPADLPVLDLHLGRP